MGAVLGGTAALNLGSPPSLTHVLHLLLRSSAVLRPTKAQVSQIDLAKRRRRPQNCIMNGNALRRLVVASRSFGSRSVIGSINSALPQPSASLTPGYCLIRTVTTKPTPAPIDPTQNSEQTHIAPTASTMSSSGNDDRSQTTSDSSADFVQPSDLNNSPLNTPSIDASDKLLQAENSTVASSESFSSSSISPSHSPTADFGGISEAAVQSDLPSAAAEVASSAQAQAQVQALQEAGPLTAFSSYLSKFFSPNSSSSDKIASVASPETVDQVSSQAETVATVATTSSSKVSDFLLTPAMSILDGVHDITGLPWWLSIALSTLAIRGLLMPFTIFTMRGSAKMQVLKPDIDSHREEVMAAAKSGDRKLAAAKQKEMQDFMRDAGIAPGRILLGPLVQFPVFISFFISIRRLAEADPSLVNGGTLWFENLSVMDPNYVLPVICGATLLGMTELGGDTGQTTMTPQMRKVMRGVGVLSIPMTYWFPAAVFCYWIPNNILSMSLGAIMRRSYMRKALGLAVDPRKIKGTKAYRQEQVKLNISQLQEKSLDPSAAVASYTKSKSIDKTKIVKPVLFKTRPPKKKAKNARNG